MRPYIQIATTTILAAYTAMLFFTDFSLTGFWTDIIFALAFAFFALRLAFKYNSPNFGLTLFIRIVTIVCSLALFSLGALKSNYPYTSDTLKLRSFIFQKVEGRIFNAYFKPVGAYAGGYGNFWITESPKYFPIVERQVYYDRTIDWDFNDETFDGKPVNNKEIVKSYIRSEVLKKPD